MSHVARSPLSSRALAIALLATTAVAALSGGCAMTGSRGGPAGDVAQMSAGEAATATSQWATAYAKNPQDPKMALGYARALRAIGSRDKAIEVLTASYQASPTNGELAAELGRLALDAGRLDIATATLKTAEAQGVRDWKTLSAQGTLRAKQGNHAEAQQYYLAALQVQPDAVSVINNLALSYALDGKAKKSEDLLRSAVASGHEDKRVRQNLALVLGLQGKFGEARQVASADMNPTQASASMSYLKNMLASQNQVAARDDSGGDDDWQPFGPDATAEAPTPTPVKTAAAQPVAPKMQVVAATDSVKAPAAFVAPAKQPAKPAPDAAGAWTTTTRSEPAESGGAPVPITPGDKRKTASAQAGLGSFRTDIV